MTIQEALRSGKPFKRTCNKDWIPEGGFNKFFCADILADDWEIEEEKVAFTRSEFLQAFADGIKERLAERRIISGLTAEDLAVETLSGVMKRLGFDK